MRADRLLSILLLLQLHGRMTAKELAARLEVSERTVHRDMEALSAAGVPVTAERGSGGGWALLEGYETKLTGLNQAEVQALFLAQPTRAVSDLGMQQALEAAHIRLLSALPATVRRDAEFVRQRILVDGAPWQATAGEPLPYLPVLQEAIWAERKVLLTYAKSEGSTSERVIEPLGLVAKGRTWYLAAAVEGGELRTYRVSRVQHAELTGDPCVRPEGFDLACYWSQSAERFVSNLPRFTVTLRVRAELLRQLGHKLRFARVEQTGEPDAEGWAPVTIRFQTEEEACEQILGMGPMARVSEPPELGQKVADLAAAVLALYSNGPSPVD